MVDGSSHRDGNGRTGADLQAGGSAGGIVVERGVGAGGRCAPDDAELE
eukprot:COSAG02_NODE_7215_length_3113_cov_19.920703_1_plen_47_part_10